MAIDSVVKRKSVINEAIPGLALLPPPDGSIDDVDRRRLADLYALGAQVITRNYWVQDTRSSSSWGSDQRSSQTWKQAQKAGTDWTEDQRVPQ